MALKDQIERYTPFNEQEEKDREQMLKFVDTFDDVLTRDNTFGHFSSSAFVVNNNRDKMVVVQVDMLMEKKIYYLLQLEK